MQKIDGFIVSHFIECVLRHNYARNGRGEKLQLSHVILKWADVDYK